MEKFTRRLGGKLGIGISLLGFFVLFLGWNGAASFGDLRQQFPYLLSGGLVGLGLIILGAAMLVTESLREQRAEMIGALNALRAAVERQGSAGGGGDPRLLMPAAGPGQVVAARLSFHTPSCRLVQGQVGLRVLDIDDALAEGLDPCRICDPTALPAVEEPYATPRRAPRRATTG
jgi:hypothetical protein